MARTIKGILVDVQNETARVVEVEDKLENYYELLDCELIEIVSRRIGRQTFTIVCDEEGVYRQPKISAIDDFGTPVLVGNLLICNTEGPELASLTNEEIKYIKARIVKQGTRRYPKGYPMLMQCAYA